MAAGERWIWLGDSIHAAVYEAPGPVRAPGANLTVVNLAKNTGAVIHNLSWGGARAADGNDPNMGWVSNFNTIMRVSGPSPATGLVITLGTNDWASPAVSGAEFVASYRGLVRAAVVKGLKVVGVTPLWRADGAAGVTKADGVWNIVEWGSFVANICSQEGAKFIRGYQAPLVPTHFADGLHLNEAGHLALEPYLRQEMQAHGYLL